jgi:hypothetical protein
MFHNSLLIIYLFLDLFYKLHNLETIGAKKKKKKLLHFNNLYNRYGTNILEPKDACRHHTPHFEVHFHL